MKATPLSERLPCFIQGKKKGPRTQQAWTHDVAPRRTRGREETTRAPVKGNVAALCEGQTADYLSFLFLHPAAQPASLLHQDQTRDQTQRHEYLISSAASVFFFFLASSLLQSCKSAIFFFIFCFSDQRSRLEVWLLASPLFVEHKRVNNVAMGVCPSGSYCVITINLWEKTTRGNRKYLYTRNHHHHHPLRLCF